MYYETAMLLAMHSNFPSKCLFLKTATGDYVHSLCIDLSGMVVYNTIAMVFLFKYLCIKSVDTVTLRIGESRQQGVG